MEAVLGALAAILLAVVGLFTKGALDVRRQNAQPNGPMPPPPLSTGTTQTVPPTNAYKPNPDTGAPEPKPDEEYPDEGQAPPEDDVSPPVDYTPPAPEPVPAPQPPPAVGPKKFTAAQQDEFFRAIGLPYGTPAKRKESTRKFQRATIWPDMDGKLLVPDSDFGVRTTFVAERCIREDYRISKYFHLYEFRCKGQDAKYGGAHCKNCAIIEIGRDVVAILDVIRERIYQGPMSITTGYRCAGYNAFVGGIKGSAHTLGLAADIPRRFSWRAFLGLGLRGIGKSAVDRSSVVHVDRAPWLKSDHVFQE
jgi:hypothetical protein